MTVGSCGNCWKLRRVAGKACNMTENALSILIVIFSVHLQQTETSGRKLFIFQHGIEVWWLIQLHCLVHWTTFNTIDIKLNKVFKNNFFFNSIQIKI